MDRVVTARHGRNSARAWQPGIVGRRVGTRWAFGVSRGTAGGWGVWTYLEHPWSDGRPHCASISETVGPWEGCAEEAGPGGHVPSIPSDRGGSKARGGVLDRESPGPLLSGHCSVRPWPRLQGGSSLKCLRCQQDNPPGSNFCLGCGAHLGAICGGCGSHLPAGSRFCNKCGTPVGEESAEPAPFASPVSYTPKHLAERILTSRSALEGERKQVTVLFADLKGSTRRGTPSIRDRAASRRST